LAVMAQRLVRVLCPHCKRGERATAAEKQLLGLAHSDHTLIYQPSGCVHCHEQGYRGRTGIYELVVVDNAMAELIHSGAGEQQLERFGRERTPGIREDGWRKVLAGETRKEEVLRITREN